MIRVVFCVLLSEIGGSLNSEGVVRFEREFSDEKMEFGER